MNKKILVINNPASILFLFSNLLVGIDELWIELGAGDDCDRRSLMNVSTLGFSKDRPVKEIKIRSLFVAGRESWLRKISSYRAIAKEVDKVCQSAGVASITCSSTSVFRLASVKKMIIVDHGAGDYLMPPARATLERLKYSYIYSDNYFREETYFSLVPLPGRKHLKLDVEEIRRRIPRAAYSNVFNRKSIVFLPRVPFEGQYQLNRLNQKICGVEYNIFLKTHQFVNPDFNAVCQRSLRWELKRLPTELEALPAELLAIGFFDLVRLASIESSAIWNVACIDPDLVIPLGSRAEILMLEDYTPARLDLMVRELGFSPFDTQNC